MNQVDYSALEKSNRLKYLRDMLKLSAKELCAKHNIPLPTWKCWESPTRSALTLKGAHRVVQVMNKENIAVEVSWLLYGDGHYPYFIHKKTDPNNLSSFNYQRFVQENIELFLQQNNNATHLKLLDDSMLPFYGAGDIVAGLWHSGKSLVNLNEKICIIEYKNRLLCRSLLFNDITGKMICFSKNPSIDTEPNYLILDLEKAAPVLIVWKSEPSHASASSLVSGKTV